MQATIAGVKLIAIAYAWSQTGVSYFISTCGATTPSPIMYISKFEDEWGNTSFKEINRPEIVRFLYEYLPLIDEHNKQRQSLLGLEKRWLTKHPWYRLITTLLGMCVVDMHRYFRYHMFKIEAANSRNRDEEQKKFEEAIDSICILQFTDLICGNLNQWE
jgi:hypothetical protein